MTALLLFAFVASLSSAEATIKKITAVELQSIYKENRVKFEADLNGQVTTVEGEFVEARRPVLKKEGWVVVLRAGRFHDSHEKIHVLLGDAQAAMVKEFRKGDFIGVKGEIRKPELFPWLEIVRCTEIKPAGRQEGGSGMEKRKSFKKKLTEWWDSLK